MSQLIMKQTIAEWLAGEIEHCVISPELTGHTKDHYKLPPCIGMHALGLEFGSAARLSKRPGSV